MNEKLFRTRLLDEALAAVERGWSVFPLSLATKSPLAPWREFQTRAPSTEEVEDWFENGAPSNHGRVATFNMALVTGDISGVVVVDCDNQEALEYARKNGLDSPFSVKTTRGMHFYHSHPNHGARFPNKVGGTAHDWPRVPGLDFRGDGGYVILPGSIRLGDPAHIYAWDIGVGLDWDDLDGWQWKGAPSEVEADGSFSFGKLSLHGVQPITGTSLTVVEDAAQRVALLGRKLTDGDGTDALMVRFCGQKVRQGVTGEALYVAVRAFYSDFFEDAYTVDETERWLSQKIASALSMDQRNYPDDWDGETRKKKSEKSEKSGTLKPIYLTDVPRLIDAIGDTEYWCDPLIPSETITQVVGYNGHGKSLFLMAVLTAMASGKESFGPYELGKPGRIFYMDFDNPRKTVLYRMRDFAQMIGDPEDRLALWSPAIIGAEQGGNMNLATEEGFNLLGEWLELTKPDVVVIDTVRNAFGGIEEASASEWFRVNHVAKTIRISCSASVVMVHHRNKPNEYGLGREAGSTAQLTDIDTQVLVTQVLREKDEAKMKGAIADGDLTVRDVDGHNWTPFGYLEAKLEPDSRLKMVTQVSFGKVRVETEMHRTHYIGWAERLKDGSQYVVSTKSDKQKARHLASIGTDRIEIAKTLHVPLRSVEDWVGKGIPELRVVK
jgi:hypothetical protein